MASKKENRYSSLVGYVFEHGFKKGKTEFTFTRDQFVAAAKKLRITLPKNIGDVLYSFRYRCPLPEGVLKTQPEGHEWVILGAGKAVYQFKLVKKSRILPSPNLMSVKIPDATPEIMALLQIVENRFAPRRPTLIQRGILGSPAAGWAPRRCRVA